MSRQLLHDLRGHLNTVMMCIYLEPSEAISAKLQPLTDVLNAAQAGNATDEELGVAVTAACTLAAEAMK